MNKNFDLVSNIGKSMYVTYYIYLTVHTSQVKVKVNKQLTTITELSDFEVSKVKLVTQVWPWVCIKIG